MRINTNISSLMARNQIDKNTLQSNVAMERLTTGKRINTAADDAAGLSISNRMSAEIRGVQQGSRNAQDAISFIQTADSALESVGDSLQRIRELTVQSASGTYSESDRVSMRAEASSLIDGIEQITSTTSFNGSPVFRDQADLEGDEAIEYALQTYWMSESEFLIEEYFGLNGQGKEISLNLQQGTAGGTLASVSASNFNALTNSYDTLQLNIERADFTPPNLPDGGTAPFYNDRIIAHEMVHAVMAANMNIGALPGWFTEGAAEFIHGADERVANDIAAADVATVMGTLYTAAGSPPTSAGYSSGYVATRMLHEAAGGEETGGIARVMKALDNGQTFTQAIASTTSFASQALFEAHVTGGAGASYVSNNMDINDADTGSIHGRDYGGSLKTQETVLANRSYDTDYTNLKLTNSNDVASQLVTHVQLSGGDDDFLGVSQIFADLSAIGVKYLDISDENAALDQLDYAIEAVADKRALLGSAENRLGHALNSLFSRQENTSAAQSRIQDADYASESASLARSQVLTQASQAMLAQANSQPSQVLSLLNF